MPIYEYKCDNGHLFEVIQKMSEEPITQCEVCGAAVIRILHSPAVHFKGSGFYNTDYGKKKTGASSESGSKSDSKPSESKSSDSKSSESKSSESKSSSSSSAD